jgi:hypothetical protein
MKVGPPDSTLKAQVVLSSTYVQIVKCGVLSYVTWQSLTAAPTNTNGVIISVVNLNDSVTTLTLPVGTGTATTTSFVLPLTYKSMTLVSEPA